MCWHQVRRHRFVQQPAENSAWYHVFHRLGSVLPRHFPVVHYLEHDLLCCEIFLPWYLHLDPMEKHLRSLAEAYLFQGARHY